MGLVIAGVVGFAVGCCVMAFVASVGRENSLEEQAQYYHDILKSERENQARSMTEIKTRHWADVVRTAAELHQRECRNIRKQGKKRGAVTGASA